MKLKKKIEIPLDEYIYLSLYDRKNGYYMKKNPFGKKGDFTTSPNISRLFSEMIAIWILTFWKNLGSPKKFNLVELGAGNGEMMKILIESFQKFPNFLNCCNFFIIEKSPFLVKTQKKKLKKNKIVWLSNIKKLKKIPTIFIANEFFDAISIKRNAIPLLGKNIQSNLMKKIVTSVVNKIYIALDKDAMKQALRFCENLMAEGKEVYLVDMQDKDPSEMGFINFTKLIQKTVPLTYSSLMGYKLAV